MLFSDLQNVLLESLKGRVRNGELTERRLARLVGVSQPHIHNVLKGHRLLSPKLADQILTHLRLSVFDLVPGDENAERRISTTSADSGNHCYIPVLKGRLGPGYPWPEAIETYERFPISASVLTSMVSPVVARLTEDVRMLPVFSGVDMLLLDQGRQARCTVETDALYVIRRGRAGAVRRLRTAGRSIYIATEDALDRPTGWERIPLEMQELTHVVRARAILLAPAVEWATLE